MAHHRYCLSNYSWLDINRMSLLSIFWLIIIMNLRCRRLARPYVFVSFIFRIDNRIDQPWSRRMLLSKKWRNVRFDFLILIEVVSRFAFFLICRLVSCLLCMLLLDAASISQGNHFQEFLNFLWRKFFLLGCLLWCLKFSNFFV